MIFLQASVEYFTPPDPRQGIIFGLIFLALILIAVIGTRLSSGGGAGGTAGPGILSRILFRRRARQHGLTRAQARLLDRITREQSVADPARVLGNTRTLDRLLSRALSTVGQSATTQAERENRKYQLFQIRRTLGDTSGAAKPVSSSRKLTAGTSLTVRTADKESYDTRVVASTDRLLAVESPRFPSGETVNWDKGEALTMTFPGPNDAMFAFKTKVAGHRTHRGKPVLYVTHSDSIQSVQKRRSPRRDFGNPAYFFPVTVATEGKGRKRRKRAVVDSANRKLGTLVDISAGGCALRSRTSLKSGSLIKISFEVAPQSPVTAFGKVLSVDPGYRGSLLHIRFTRVSRTNLNDILAYVYGYTSGP